MSTANNTANLMTGFSSQCFPVRSLTNYKRADEGGAWLVAYRAEQRRRFQAVLCNDPVASPQPVQRKQGRKTASPVIAEENKSKKLDGFYLMKQFYVEDPSDLCSIKISGRELREVSEDDFLLFDNVVHIDAGDNNLPFTAFNNFTSLRELEIPLNSLSGSIKVESHDFHHLEKLDLSYNRVTGQDILALGLLQSIRTLHLTGNEIKRLPIEMARTYRTITGITASGTVESQDRKVRFNRLENLYLDQNELTDLSTFASLAGLKSLKYLNLEHNEITSIPHLRLLGTRLRQSEDRSIDTNMMRKENMNEPGIGTLEQEKSTILDREHEASDEHDEENAEEKEELGLNEVDEVLSRNLPGDDKERDESNRVAGIRPHSSSLTEDTSLLGDKYHPPLPFPSLLHLNLANNMVFEEEGLLAIMGWPYVRELVIWGNPLTTAFKGDPPVISMQLGRVKGVSIFRQKPVKRPKPAVNIPTSVTNRKVQDVLPPVPRKRDILMLEGPPKPAPIAYVGPRPRALPPISVPAGSPSRGQSVTPRHLSTAPAQTDTSAKELRHISNRSRSVPPGVPTQSSPGRSTRRGMVGAKTTGEATPGGRVSERDTRRHGQAGGMTQTDEGFFMTQVDEREVNDAPVKEAAEHRKTKSKRTKHEHSVRPFSVETKYKGYEDLLDVDEVDPDVVIPDDIQTSVRSLHYALQHPLIFTESNGNYKETPKKAKVDTDTKPSRQNKVDQLGHILDRMRVKTKTVESNLENVLKDYSKDSKLRKQFPKAKTLLNEVQKKYNEVRVASLRSGANVRFSMEPENLDSGRADSGDSESLESDFLEEERQVLNELKKFKERLDKRI